MDKSLLVRIFGFPATLAHGDPLVLDRWRWMRRRLPRTRNGDALVDIGCGSGAFTIGAALRGYSALGLSWDQRNQSVASERAALCRAVTVSFEVFDVRNLAERADLYGRFDFAICAENIEHVLDDAKLITSIAACLTPGGRLLLTTPFFHYRAITAEDDGPFSRTEDGWHVRRGYTSSQLRELCEHAGLVVEEISYCGGFLAQKLTGLQRLFRGSSPMSGWLLTLPFRPLPPLLDGAIGALTGWPAYSICLEAVKPRLTR